MASDSREERSVSVELPADVDEWVDERAGELGVDRADVVVQLVSAHRAAEELEGDADAAAILGEDLGELVDVEAAIAEAIERRSEELLAEPVAAAVEREFADRLADEVEAAVEEHLPTLTDAVEGRIEERSTGEIEDRIDALEAEFQEKIVDVRERVIQVKKETDGKAAVDHDHEALERVDALDERLQTIAETVEELEGAVETLQADVEAGPADDGEAEEWRAELDERLGDAEDKLNRVAWVVSDLTDEAGGRTANEQAVARIKRAAAQESVGAATCERCGESVDVALLTDPECPHCDAAVSDVRPTGGILRKKATLVAASQLESGEQ